MPPAHSSILSPLRHPAYRLIWIATLVANLGTLVQGVGAAWAMAELTPSESMVAMVQASTTLPVMVLALIAGAIADNYNRRKVMLAAQIFMAITSGILAVLGYFDLLTPWTLLSFTFLLGLGSALNLPAWQASVRDMVPMSDLPAAITLNSVSFNLMRSVGPAIGGVIVAAAGAEAAFALNALSYLAVIYAFLRWKLPDEERLLPAEKLGAAVYAGLRYVWLSPDLLKVMARGLIFGIAAVAVMALLPVMTRDVLGGDATTFGFLLGSFGLGAIGGAMISSRARRVIGIEGIVKGAALAFAIGMASLAFVADLWHALPGLLLCGAAWVLALSHFNVSVQLSTPRWVVARALATYQTLTFGGMAIGSWLWGAVTEAGSLELAFLLAALLLFICALMGFVLPMPNLSEANLDPANRFNTPALALDLKARSGPIMVMVDWHIAPENTDAFLALMGERRRIRRRDGARQWALLRDLQEPNIWVESYHSPTWTDYLRHNQRRTQADMANYDQLFPLHAGPGRPRVHVMIERHSVPQHDDMPVIPRTDEPH